MRIRSISRRDFVKKMMLGSAALTSYGMMGRCRTKLGPPNILFCISDDQSYPHASAYGVDFVKTPAFDRVAQEGILFHNAFVSSPSCCPSRGSVLTGQEFYRLGEASMNHTIWPGGLGIYPDILVQAGYAVGFTGKGWGPGNWQASGRAHNPAGPAFNQKTATPPGSALSRIDYAANFRAFLDQKEADLPFCFWVGFSEPHREYEKGIGVRHGKPLDTVRVPGFFPDVAEVRSDLADYAFEIEYYDSQLTRILRILEEQGELDNTLILVTADNGMPFPRAKATLYDYGVRVPLAIRWGARVNPGREVKNFVSFTDFAPTFLQAAGLEVPSTMTGKSLMPILLSDESGSVDPARDYAVFGIERHFPGSRPQGAGYPMRAIRTAEYLYIRNLTPEKSPVGDHPGPVWPQDDPVGGFGDIDGSPTKTYMWEHRDAIPELSQLAFGTRAAEELYDVRIDPFSLKNLAVDTAYAPVKKRLSAKLDAHLQATADPRAVGRGDRLDAVMKRFPDQDSNR